MSEEKQRYHSFLLRLWKVRENEHTAWRASLESSHTGERWGFADLDALCVFLHEQTTILDLTGFGKPVRSEEKSIQSIET
jgi:hypothetical protein